MLSKNKNSTKLESNKKIFLTFLETWVLLRYESGDRVNDSQCLGRSRKASVYIVCDPVDHDDQVRINFFNYFYNFLTKILILRFFTG